MQKRHDGPAERCSAIARRIATAVLLLISVIGISAVHPPSAADGEPGVFHSLEVRSANLKPFGKWLSALERYAREVDAEVGRDCGADETAVCPYRRLDAFLAGLRGKSRRAQLTAVNAYMNARPYVADTANWGESDYWETPAEFLDRSGDCEDYAIAKFFALKRLGWDTDALRLVAVRDLQRGIGHAVLIVFDEGGSLLLDNQIEAVVATGAVERYQPVYSINEHAWWRHTAVTPARAAGIKLAALQPRQGD